MAIKTQGTQLFAIDPDDDSLISVSSVTEIDGIDTSIDQIETTVLAAMARTYEAGLATPGTATFGIYTDTSNPEHIRLHQLKTGGKQMKWAIGWSDGTDAPTVDVEGVFTLPATRSWLEFEGYMNSYPFNFSQNSVVSSSIGIQVSGEPKLTAKS